MSRNTHRYLGGQTLALFLLLCLWLSVAALAAPFARHFTFTQPDGTKIDLWGEGDEFHAVFETLDGHAVQYDQASRSYQYVGLSADGAELVPTGAKVGAADPQALGLQKHLRIKPAAAKDRARVRRQQWEQGLQVESRWQTMKAASQSLALTSQGPGTGGIIETPAPPTSTTTGTKVGLCLLVDFSDAPASIAQAEIINFCNGTNYTNYGNHGSVRQYYYDVSNGLLTYTNIVTIYIRAPQLKTNYNDTAVGEGTEGRKLLTDIIATMKALPNYATEILPTFGGLSVDGSSRVLACNVFFAGANSGVWSYGLWPHSSSLSSAVDLGNGKKVYRYQISDIGTSLEIGTFCHENGHLLCGFPDLYDYGSDSSGGAGKFCLMGSGNWNGSPQGANPAQLCAYLKRASGWATTVELTSTTNLSASVSASGADFNKFYRYQKPGVSTEYFLIENRQKSGHDADLPGAGIAIWHIDELGDKSNQSTNYNTSHLNYEVSLMQADNLWHLQAKANSGDTKDLYYAGNSSSAYTGNFSDTSTPTACWWSGALSGLVLRDFSAPNATMSFAVGAASALLTVQANPTNGGSVTGGGTYLVGSNVQLRATATNLWRFINWNDGNTNAARTVTVPDGGTLYTANFAPLAIISVTANTNSGGSVTGGGTFLVGSTIGITATASNLWRFIRWSDGNTNRTRNVLVTLDGATYTAVFAPTAVLTVLPNPSAGGEATGGGTYVVGSNAWLTATASNLWRFIAWSDGDTNASRLVSVPEGGTTISANFSQLGTVLVVGNPSSLGSVAGSGLYLVGSGASLTATVSSECIFLNWNGSITNNPWLFTVPSGTTVCTANFARLGIITVTANTTNGGSVAGSGAYAAGTSIPITALASNGWRFTSWADGNPLNPRTINVQPSNVIYTALFAYLPLSAALGQALNTSGLIWQPGGDADWSTTTGQSRDGLSAQSGGALAGGQQSWIQTTTNGPGSLMFWWKITSEIGDTLQFTVNGQLQAQLASSSGWQQYVGFLSSSNVYTLRWTFTKNAFSMAGSNAGWVDQINWMPCPYAEHVPLIFYQDPTGLLASWVIGTNASFQFARILANTGGWALKCAGDVDGDGVSDLLFATAGGDAAGWFMNADGSTRSARYWFNLSGWEIKACGDYEGIGRGQLFFQNAAGVTAYWRLDTNGNYLAAVPVGAMGGWKLRGAGDLDGDGKAELFWQNAAGTVVIWYHNPNGTIRGGTPFNTGNWALCGIADIDGDGVSDLVWQNSAGLTGGWFMNSNGTARAASYWWGTGAWKLKAAGR